MFRCNSQDLGSATSSDLGGIYAKIFLYALRQPVVVLHVDSLPTSSPPPPWQIPGCVPGCNIRDVSASLG